MGLHHLLEELLRSRRRGHHGYGHHGQGGHHGRYYPYDEYSQPYPERVLDCPNCHAENALEARFCQRCGQALGSPQVVRTRVAQCPGCGAGLPATARYCLSCGTQV